MTKTMKNSALAVVAALALSLTICIAPAFADTGFSSNDSDTKVTYTVSEGYTVTVPADVTFASESLSQTKAVSASNVIIANGKKLVVKVASTNSYALKYGDGTASSIAYTVTPAGGSALSGAEAQEVLSIAAGTTSGSKDLTFATNASGFTKAGDHTDTLTFTCSVVDAS